MFRSSTPFGDDLSNATNFFVNKPNDVSNLKQYEIKLRMRNFTINLLPR